MLFSYYWARKPFRKNIVIQGVLYKKSKKLKEIDFILSSMQFIFLISFPSIAYVLGQMNIQILNISPTLLIWIGLMLGYLVMIPIYAICLPNPIFDHLTQIENDKLA